MSNHYKKFLRLLENWPIDTTKPGRDLGEYLRKQLKQSLRAGSLTVNGTASIDSQFQALERICNNVHAEKYPRIHNSTSSGVDAKNCGILISEESLRYFSKEAEKGLFARFVGRAKFVENVFKNDEKTDTK